MTSKIMDAIVKVSEGSDTPEDVLIVRKLLQQAKNGDMQAMKLLFNYVDGMPVQGLEVGGPGGEPIAITVNFN